MYAGLRSVSILHRTVLQYSLERKLLHSYSHEHYSYTVIILLNQAENTINHPFMSYGYISYTDIGLT